MHFILRPWNLADLNSLVKYADNAAIAKYMTDQFPHPYTPNHGRNFIQFATTNPGARIFAIQVADEAVGGIGLHPQTDIQRNNAELGYWLGEPFWGHGIMTRAIEQIVTYGFQHLPITRIFARPFGSNLASQRVLEKSGFNLEARLPNTFCKNKVLEDELIYAIRRP